MNQLFSYALLVLAALTAVAALYFAWRAWRTRGRAGRQAYGFGQVEVRKEIRIDVLRALIGGVAALLLGAAGGVGIAGPEIVATPTPSPTQPATTRTPETALTATSPALSTSTASPTPTSPLPTQSPSPTATITPTPSATPLPSARVNSPNGLFLRDVPGGAAEIELLADGALLTLLGETAENNGLEWVLVRSAAGNVGWVAVDFIEIQ